MRSTRVAVLLATALTAAIMTGCAQPGAHLSAAPAADSGPETYARLVDRIYGTTEQRAAGNERQHYAWQAALGSCMTGKGADFVTPAWISSPVRSMSPGDVLAFAPRRDGYGIADRIIAMARDGQLDNAAASKLTGDARAQWLKVQEECNPATTPTEEQHLAEGMIPLNKKFVKELRRIQDEVAPELRADYATCMGAAGLPAVKEISDAYGVASQKFPYQALADDVENPAAIDGFAEAVAYEKQVTAKDWSCRGTESARVLEASAEPLSAWAAANQAEIDKVSANWAKMPAERDAARAAALKISTK